MITLHCVQMSRLFCFTSNAPSDTKFTKIVLTVVTSYDCIIMTLFWHKNWELICYIRAMEKYLFYWMVLACRKRINKIKKLYVIINYSDATSMCSREHSDWDDTTQHVQQVHRENQTQPSCSTSIQSYWGCFQEQT